MKKGLFVVLFALLAGMTVNAQAFQGKGSSQLSVGITSGFNTYNILGIQGNYDYGVADFISVGGQVNLLFDDDFKMYVGPRANFHLLNAITPSKTGPFDVYLSATMGVQFGGKTKFNGGGYLGASYDITSHIAVKLEVGSNVMAACCSDCKSRCGQSTKKAPCRRHGAFFVDCPVSVCPRKALWVGLSFVRRTSLLPE